ncbi:MAG: ankyrin repeat domain-containing protein, partial [Treponema sp.]|nr:ankyrin repeat domain-containing protein [Treponema sp.]
EGDTQKVDGILGAGGITAAEKRLAYRFVLDYTRGETTLQVMELLRKHGIRAVQYDLFNALDKSHANGVIDHILDDGIGPNGEILLLAAEKQRWDLVKRFAGMGADLNYKYPADKSYADGMTALIHAAKNNNLEMVSFLVEHGADVNMRTVSGATAASTAYENGFLDVYNYLKDHGAADFAPAAPQAVAQAETAGGPGIASLVQGGTPAFRNGTYRLSGSTAEITFTGSGGSGYLAYRNSAGSMAAGVFRVTENTLLLTTEGITFTYRVDGAASFSGNGETWVRVGD